jgi:GTP-binding protein
MFHDRARIYIEGGRGGDGCVSFRREARVPKGGPDGGDGGRGGDVVLVGDSSRRDLGALRTSRHHRAAAGGHGQGKRKHGARGADQLVLVPPGTQIEGLGGEQFDLVSAGQRATVARGGSSGHGNKRFASATRQTPRFAERGLEGQGGWIELRMKLLADVGLIGLPNAGKSSLIRRLTRATPNVASYPFTTVEPVLGTLDTDERQLVIADIPGLIEGAADGAGLGLEFLAHVERCRALVHLVEIDPGAAGTEAGDGGEPAGDPFERATRAYDAVRGELVAYGAGLDALPELVLLSKSDLAPTESVDDFLRRWRERLGDTVLGVLSASSATGDGIDALAGSLLSAVPEGEADAVAAEQAAARRGEPATPSTSPPPSTPLADGEFATEHRVYRPAAEQGFRVEQLEDGVFSVEGRGAEVLVRRHDRDNPEALAYLEQRLREIGVLSALEAAGFAKGDEVRIGEHAFELDPG